jgi:hypothetical protein
MELVLEKMKTIGEPFHLDFPNKLKIAYNLGTEKLNEGQHIRLTHSGNFFCTVCNKKVKKLVGGFCYVCLNTKAQADICFMSPHKCHFHLGTCREPNWAEQTCFQPHVVYLAYTDKFKVGITRTTQVPTRWIDQGALSAKIIAEVPNRYIAGLIEKSFTAYLPDKTHWLKMLLNFSTPPNSETWQETVDNVTKEFLPEVLKQIMQVNNFAKSYSLNQVESFFNFTHAPFYFEYPQKFVPQTAKTFKSVSFDKQPQIEGELLGIKGQYIYFTDGVLNIRRHAGYEVELQLS